MSENPDDIMKAAENALDNMLCNCRESLGSHEAVRAESIKDIARALLAQDKAATERAAKIAEATYDSKNHADRSPRHIAAAIRSQP